MWGFFCSEPAKDTIARLLLTKGFPFGTVAATPHSIQKPGFLHERLSISHPAFACRCGGTTLFFWQNRIWSHQPVFLCFQSHLGWLFDCRLQFPVTKCFFSSCRSSRWNSSRKPSLLAKAVNACMLMGRSLTIRNYHVLSRVCSMSWLHCSETSRE